jgi:hypothetical protein
LVRAGIDQRVDRLALAHEIGRRRMLWIAKHRGPALADPPSMPI